MPLDESLSYRLRQLETRANKVYVDMYEGTGSENPSMTVRVDRLEKCVEAMVRNGSQTRTMMLATMMTVIGGILTAFVCYKMGIRI